MSGRRAAKRVGAIGTATALVALIAVVTGGASGCKTDATDSVLRSQDRVVAAGTTFDPNELVDSQSFADSSSLAEGDLSQFLHATPYGAASFLETYQSDGTSATDAVLTASQTYSINPLVFFAEAEAAQGLIGLTTYPTDASRVEFVFRCGCFASGDCDPAFAGFDKQVNCLGQQLRTSLDAIAANGKTAGGWGPMVTKTSADGVSVDPNDDSTAALYELDPYVGVGSGGGWLFWNVYNLYATQVGYNHAETAPVSGWVGDSCFTAEGCEFASAVCARGGYPNGMCTKECASDMDCPNDATHTTTFCAAFNQPTGYCVVSCSSSTANSCRDQYRCANVDLFGSTSAAKEACIPM